MQLVGSNCEVCEEKISFAPDAIECPQCDIALHRNCISGGTICPQCSNNVVHLLEAKEQAEQELIIGQVQSGRKLLLYIFVPYLLVFIGFLASLWQEFNLESFISAATTLLVTISLIRGVYTGLRWARNLFLGLCWFGLVTRAMYVPDYFDVMVSEPDIFTLLFVAMLIFYIAVIYALQFSDDVKLFLYAQRMTVANNQINQGQG